MACPSKKPTTCPHCGITRFNMYRHVCPESPEIVAWLAEHLPDPAEPHRIISYNDYLSLPDQPISAPTLNKYIGWPALAARFGLEERQPRGGTPQLAPVERAELHRLAQELHGGRIGPSHGEYGIYARDVPRKETGLAKAFGGWRAVLAAAGLPAGRMSDYVLASNARRRAHQAGRPNQNERSTFDRGDEPISRDYTGIPVMPTPRQLPSGGVAWTVR